MTKCSFCNGTGEFEERHPYGETYAIETLPCRECRGTGRELPKMKRGTWTINAAGWQTMLPPIFEGEEHCPFCAAPYVPDYSDPTDPLDCCVDCHHDIRVYGGYLSQPIFGVLDVARFRSGENIGRFASFLVIHERQLNEVEWAAVRLEQVNCAKCGGTGIVENVAASYGGDEYENCECVEDEQ